MAPENPAQDCKAHQEAIATLKDSDKRQWDAITNLQNRLPTWATVVFSILTFLLGFISAVKVSDYTAVRQPTPPAAQKNNQAAIKVSHQGQMINLGAF